MLLVTGQQPPRGPGIPGALSYAVLEELGGGVFETLEDHTKDIEPDLSLIHSDAVKLFNDVSKE